MKEKENLIWSSNNIKTPGSVTATVSKLMFGFILLLAFPYIFYSLNFLFSSNPTNKQYLRLPNPSPPTSALEPLKNTHPKAQQNTTVHHIAFGIAASSKLWKHRKNYIKLWWRPNEMRGIVWLDEPVNKDPDDDDVLPPRMISRSASNFHYNQPEVHQSGIRISRMVSETLKQGMKDVRWFVMGDDDTVFVADNLVRVLSKYDHNQYYYIGSSSESHLQNIYFSYGMAFGGGGFAISYPLAKALANMQDRCIERYSGLYGSDDRIQACMAELGVPLTIEPGFHQFDVYGNLFGLLAAHPIAPLVTLHHLDLVEPIFPNMDRIQALQKLKVPIQLDSAALMQQSICYDNTRQWTVSVSWGYTVQIFRGMIMPREIERPARTFLNWQKTDYTGFAFNTRPVIKNLCQKPFVYSLFNASYATHTKKTVSEYVRNAIANPVCRWKMEDPSDIDKIEVYKKPNPYLWDKAPRRNCCRILPTEKNGSLKVDVGECKEDEVIETQ
ncbi:hypothetical protein JCGZ_14361 [Jatropha curcas]|uniref:Transferring glycosyl group transferase n=1 Tax=Jatropha curcas TaxID=180498 RepID=A0A067K8I9_JATCU|nr:uncharacterized protein LOC110008630 [Jatropha curcas]KDP28590.1 hypothetical protein JCGZ_14361 [Jatropha curcas]